MNPNKEKYDQQLAIREKQKQMEIPVELIKIQDRYNKQNLEKQHKFNLEIFEKQADLSREIHKKQTRLAIISIWLAIVATLLGAVLGSYLPSVFQKQGQIKKTAEQSMSIEKATQQQTPSVSSVQTESSSTIDTSKPPITNQ